MPAELRCTVGTNTLKAPSLSTNRNAFSRLTGVVGSTVSRLIVGYCGTGAPCTPENTMFHTPPDQLPMELLRVYHCCCEQGFTLPVIKESAIKPPLDWPQFVLVNCSGPLTYMRRKSAP